MNFFYRYTKIVYNANLVGRLNIAANNLLNDLQNINPLDLHISEYNQRYLKDKLQAIEPELRTATYTIAGTLSHSRKSLEDTVFIEYGGGVGLFSLLAKRLGVGTVIYNDIYDISCKDAKEIAKVLGCEADYYVQGDIDDLIAFCNRHELKCDGMGSYDVLEHTYDIDAFCRKLHLLSYKGTTMIHSSGANIFSYPYVKSVSKKQREVEISDREAEWGHKKRDCLRAYLKERAKIIRECTSNLNEDEIKQMAINTRGLMRDAIVQCMEQYNKSKEFPKLIEHPTNTCDPYTGNWMEHLMNPYYLKEGFLFNGFDAKVLPGYWTPDGNLTKKSIASVLNFTIHVLDTHTGLHLSPYYSIFAKYNGSFSEERHKQHIYRCHHSPFWYIVLVLWELFSHLYYRQLGIPEDLSSKTIAEKTE